MVATQNISLGMMRHNLSMTRHKWDTNETQKSIRQLTSYTQYPPALLPFFKNVWWWNLENSNVNYLLHSITKIKIQKSLWRNWYKYSWMEISSYEFKKKKNVWSLDCGIHIIQLRCQWIVYIFFNDGSDLMMCTT